MQKITSETVKHVFELNKQRYAQNNEDVEALVFLSMYEAGIVLAEEVRRLKQEMAVASILLEALAPNAVQH